MTQPLFHLDANLTPRQQLVYQAAALQPLTALAAGILLHTASDCAYCTEDRPCQYADRNGREVLEALRKKGLLKRGVHHIYQRTTPAPQSADEYDPATADIPF